MSVFERINEKMSDDNNALRVTNVTTNGKVVVPQHDGTRFKYLARLSDMPQGNPEAYLKDKFRELGSGDYKIDIVQIRGNSYVHLSPPFSVIVPVKKAEDQTQPTNTSEATNIMETKSLGLSIPDIIDLKVKQTDYNRLTEERVELKERIKQLEAQLESAIRKAELAEFKTERLETKNELAIERLKIELEAEKAKFKSETEKEKEEFIKNKTSFLDKVDVNKMMENPILVSMLSKLMPPENGLNAPAGTETFRHFANHLQNKTDDELQRLYMIDKFMHEKPEFLQEIKKLINKHYQNEQAA